MGTCTRYFRRRRSSVFLLATVVIISVLGLWYFNLLKLSPQDVHTKRVLRYQNYQQSEMYREGPGEFGRPVYLKGAEEEMAAKLIDKEAFNRLASDKISLERAVKDVRDKRCLSVKYSKDLPKASVVIIFHNEAWSPLLRTAHSVINRSPPEYLHEVVLLDDFSDKEHLKGKLEKYISATWPDGIVRLVRTSERSGLIRARIAGAKAATGDVLIFLDSHCEASPGWIEPLLYRIKQDRTAVLCPEIDLIDKDTLEYQTTGSYSIGGFWWSLHFSWRPIPHRELKRRMSDIDPIRIEPLLSRVKADNSVVACPIIDNISDKTLEYSDNGGYQIGGFTWSLHFTWQDGAPHPVSSPEYIYPIGSPTMAGGLFAVDRKYFFEIGAYDPGMDVWGGENLELSFRVWMCGGRVEFIPCSRVGHIFRSSHPYTFPGNKDTHGINSMRLAEVWMDDYKRLFYMHRRELLNQDCGDLSERKALRKKLNCKSFKWYLDHVYPEKFIVDENVKAWGMVRNQLNNLCLDTLQKDEKTIFQMGLFYCQNGGSASQVISYTPDNFLKREEACLETEGNDGSTVFVRPCRNSPTMKWIHDKSKSTIVHQASGKCLDVAKEKSNGLVRVKTCNEDLSQQWSMQHYLDM